MRSVYFISIIFLKITISYGFSNLTINYENFDHFGYTFKGSAFKIVKNIGLYACAQLCLQRSVCASLCYEDSKCHLFHIEVAASSLENKQGSIYTTKASIANLLMQNETTECGNSGICSNGKICVWSNTPACVITECTDLPMLESPSYLASNDSTVGLLNTIKCDYRSKGNNSIICKADGTWTLPSLTCHTDCLEPPKFDSMTANSSDTMIGTAVNFTCNLPKLGSSLIVCNESAQWTSVDESVCYLGKTCEEAITHGVTLNGSSIMIDPYQNGSAYSVMCEESEGKIYTIISHNSSDATEINGNGSISLGYSLPTTLIVRLMNLSKNCKQHVNFTCMGTNIFNNTNQNVGFLNRFGAIADYFPGGNTGTCACRSHETCRDENANCNCDGTQNSWGVDEGYVTNIADLPISSFYVLNGTTAFVEIGMVMCY